MYNNSIGMVIRAKTKMFRNAALIASHLNRSLITAINRKTIKTLFDIRASEASASAKMRHTTSTMMIVGKQAILNADVSERLNERFYLSHCVFSRT